MISKVLTRAFAVAVTGAVLVAVPAHAQCNPKGKAACNPAAKAQTITASVVDMSCYLANGLHGADHKMCSEVCAKAGVPLVFLGEDGQLYLPVSTAMPSKGFNDKLVKHAEQKVKVTGKVINKAGSRSIVVEKLVAAD
ncbi:MAG: hypothetical protein ACE5HQ_09625 [Gemmatimonadota bacterium]